NRIALSYRGELNWQHMLDFYRLRAIEGVERVSGESYQRNVCLDNSKAWFQASKGEGNLELEFEIEEV
ncbi:AlkA N-terminal domain-containing protein, partial [Vibrio parahaemolyticus]